MISIGSKQNSRLAINTLNRWKSAYRDGGDECLRQISAALKNSVQRPGDQVARYGGEEFALILPSTELGGALHVAELLRTTVRSLALPHGGSPFDIVTVRVGVASIVPRAGDVSEVVLAEADAALYGAKQAGRDRVYHQSGDGLGTCQALSTDVQTGAEAERVASLDRETLSPAAAEEPFISGEDALGWLGLQTTGPLTEPNLHEPGGPSLADGREQRRHRRPASHPLHVSNLQVLVGRPSGA